MHGIRSYFSLNKSPVISQAWPRAPTHRTPIDFFRGTYSNAGIGF